MDADRDFRKLAPGELTGDEKIIRFWELKLPPDHKDMVAAMRAYDVAARHNPTLDLLVFLEELFGFWPGLPMPSGYLPSERMATEREIYLNNFAHGCYI